MRPTAELGEWRGVEVARREPPAIDEADVERQLEQARERLARLETVERAAARGDFVVVDYTGAIDGEPIEGGQGRGAADRARRRPPDPRIRGGPARCERGRGAHARAALPRRLRGEPSSPGATRDFDVTVTEVREKLLPELDDDFATDAAGLDTLEELREDIRAGCSSRRARGRARVPRRSRSTPRPPRRRSTSRRR